MQANLSLIKPYAEKIAYSFLPATRMPQQNKAVYATLEIFIALSKLAFAGFVLSAIVTAVSASIWTVSLMVAGCAVILFNKQIANGLFPGDENKIKQLPGAGLMIFALGCLPGIYPLLGAGAVAFGIFVARDISSMSVRFGDGAQFADNDTMRTYLDILIEENRHVKFLTIKGDPANPLHLSGDVIDKIEKLNPKNLSLFDVIVTGDIKTKWKKINVDVFSI
jgi:hypothetical protein